MSFCSDVKTELVQVHLSDDCCAAALLYGMLQCGHAFTVQEISLHTDSRETAALYAALLERVCGVTPSPAVPAGRSGVAVAVPAEACTRVLDRFGHQAGETALRLNRANLDCEGCAAAYLRGVFLACAAMTDPEKGYHLEFNISSYRLCRDIATLFDEEGFVLKPLCRKGSHLLYLKESERIEDLLTTLGAPMASLGMMNVKMVKSIRNKVNRVTNCENANIDKTVAAAAVCFAAIEKISQNGGLSQLPEELREIAVLRYDNPEMSLRDLGELLEPPLSRSGVNHRLKRLIEYADHL